MISNQSFAVCVSPIATTPSWTPFSVLSILETKPWSPSSEIGILFFMTADSTSKSWTLPNTWVSYSIWDWWEPMTRSRITRSEWCECWWSQTKSWTKSLPSSRKPILQSIRWSVFKSEWAAAWRTRKRSRRWCPWRNWSSFPPSSEEKSVSWDTDPKRRCCFCQQIRQSRTITWRNNWGKSFVL